MSEIEINVEYSKLLTLDLEIGIRYGQMQDNGEVVVLGILESMAQCGYANGGKCFRLFFNNNDIKTKYVKAWNYIFIKL